MAIWLCDTDGKNAKELIRSQRILVPAWLPDSKHIVWMSAGPGRKVPLRLETKATFLPSGDTEGIASPGNAYNTQSYGKAIKYICQRAGIPSWSPNQLRHSAGTMVRREYGLEGAQVTLGHSSANITQIYAETDMSRAIEIALQDSSRLVS